MDTKISSPPAMPSTNIGNVLKSAVLLIVTFWLTVTSFRSSRASQQQAKDTFFPSSQLIGHCAKLPPIGAPEFLHRQTVLADTLRKLGASGYIAEPGASAQFYGNISQSHWSLSERPFLLIITPSYSDAEGALPNVSILTPKFEAARARSLPMPSDVQYIEWPEDANPYSVVASVLHNISGPVFVDDSIRAFLVDGLQEALPSTTISTAPRDVKLLRERKSKAELELLKCANEVTVMAIREVQKKMYIGMHESQAREMMASALCAAGLLDGGCLTLFGENAALPHGRGTDRILEKSDFALFDCTGSLHGYYSDVTRTIALPSSQIPMDHLQIWNYVHSAQTVASHAAREGTLTRDVDKAARTFLEQAGYAAYFSHRLGHGIGLEVHEGPYLRGGTDDVIKSGHTFSNEPGVYIEGKVGVRLEDCFYISTEGKPIFLTEDVGGQSISPWSP